MADNIARKDYTNVEMVHVLFLIGVLNGITTCVGTAESHGQAFIQTDNNELRYMVDGHIGGVFNVMQDENSKSSIKDEIISTAPIRFQPAMLDFREQAVGIPKMQQVTVHNPDGQASLHLLSISGSSSHFHCSFFQDKMVPRGGNTSFDVVFLARQVGSVANNLYIHTSQGSFKYQVFGTGIRNPYRVQPFLGAKLPVNSSFSSLIHMHNPHSSTLQVVEMYSSAGDLHLELPTGEKEAPSNLWEIPPYETKSVMKASFYGREESNHTAFIRIRTNREKSRDTLVLPVEVEVTSSPGIFSTVASLNFGILRTLDEPKILRLNLINYGTDPVYITSVSLESPNDAVSIDFRPIKLQPDVLMSTQVASVSFTASKAVDPAQFKGSLVVKTKNGHKLLVPYHADVFHGSLVYDTNRTHFFTGYKEIQNISRDFIFTNTFNFTLAIYNISLAAPAQPHFKISGFSSPTLLDHKASATVFTLHLLPQQPLLHLTSELYLYTNGSTFTVPIVLYNGRLKVVHHRPEIFAGQLDFGTLGIEEAHSMSFTLRNDNPIDIVCREFGANMDKAVVELLGVERGNGTLLTRTHNTSEIDTDPLVLKPYHYAVFNLNLIAPDWEGTFAAEVIIVTQNENLYIPMTLRTAEGSLKSVPDKIVIDKCFPSKLPYKELQIHSSFTSYMEVRKVTFQPNDTRFYYVPPKHKPVLLEPQQDNIIGRIYFDPRRECKDDCYLSLPTSVLAGHHWLVGATLDNDVTDTDQYLYTRFTQQWQEIGQNQLSTINVTVQLDTKSLRGFLFPAQAHLHWPTLTKKWKIRFPLTQIGNISYSEFIVENPSDSRVLMQILPLPLYPNPQTVIDILSPRLSSEFTDYIEMDDNEIFILPDLEPKNSSMENTVPNLRRGIENSLGVKPHKDTIAMMVDGGTKVKVRVGFKPKDDLFRTSLILIRNNLTIIDSVIVQGQGGIGEMRFSSRKPGSAQPLMFEMTEKHLKGCEKRKQSKITPSFTVKRSFTARNMGQLPFWVDGFYINDSKCQGYGFVVLDCEGFELAPNATRKVDIVVTPDFTMSRMRRTLSLHTSLGEPLNYTMQVTIPAHMLTRCASALPRPACEPVLYYLAVCITVFMILGVCVAAYFEADHIFTADLLRRHAKAGTGSSSSNGTNLQNSMPGDGRAGVFNLKALGTAAGKLIMSDNTSNNKMSPTSTQRNNTHPPTSAAATATNATATDNVRKSKRDQQNAATANGGGGYVTWMRRLFKRLSQSVAQMVPDSNKPPSRAQPLQSAAGTKSASEKPTSIVAPTINTSTIQQQEMQGQHKLKLKSKASKKHMEMWLESDKKSEGVYSSSGGGSGGGGSSEREPQKAQHLCTHTRDNKSAVTATTAAATAGGTSSKLQSDQTSTTSEITMITSEDDNRQPSSTNYRQSKKPKVTKKSKTLMKQEAKERKQREKRQQELIDLDKDECSSTTTESSNPDVEDKILSTRESTPDIAQSQQKRKTKALQQQAGGKKESVPQRKAASPGGAAPPAEEEFMITSKSRAHKNIKIDSKSAFGGNIMKPSTLDLPYTAKVEPVKSGDKDSVETSKPRRSKALKKTKPGSDLTELSLQTQQFISSLSSTNKPGSALIGSSRSNASSLAAGSSATANTDGSSAAAAAAKRGSSYSSIVSSGIKDTATTTAGTNSTVTGITSNNPMGNNKMGLAGPGGLIGNPLLDTHAYLHGSGVVGSSGASSGGASPPNVYGRPVSNQMDLAHHQMTAASGLGGGTAGTGGVGSGGIFPVPPLGLDASAAAAAAAGVFTNPPPNIPPGTIGMRGAANPNLPPPLSGSSWLPPPAVAGGEAHMGDSALLSGMNPMYQGPTADGPYGATMMQRLQMERRRRYAEYHNKMVTGEDWPGFNDTASLPTQNLWDDHKPAATSGPTLGWTPPPPSSSAPTTVPPQSQAQPPLPLPPSSMGLWDNPAAQAATSWNPVASIWNSDNPSSPPSSATHGITALPPHSAGSANTSGGSGSAGFDPFTAYGSIWNPSTAGDLMPPSGNVDDWFATNTTTGAAAPGLPGTLPASPGVLGVPSNNTTTPAAAASPVTPPPDANNANTNNNSNSSP